MQILYASETWRKECLDHVTDDMLGRLDVIVAGDASVPHEGKLSSS